MTWNDFYAMVTAKFSYTYTYRGRDKLEWHGTPEAYVVEWRSGGIGGGNCWGDSPSYSLEADDVPDLVLLDEFLEEICPTLTFVSYNRIIKTIVAHNSREINEYYGNYTVYSTKTINFRKLYDALIKEGALS